MLFFITKFNKMKLNMENEKRYEVVVGIDFGSSGSGYAFSFMNEKDIIHGQIPGANVDSKVPTEIILDNENYCLQFGASCKQYLKEKGYDCGHYYKDIKMQLYSRKKEIKASNSGKNLSLKLVIQRVLEKLKELALEDLKKSWKYINENNIKWVVTVPAIWEDFQKGIMMEASKKSGLISENTDKSLFFALEPEAASLYCSRNPNIRQEYLMKGKYYIICDLGGGTGDIVTHLVGSNKKLKEISPSCGGAYGSNEIDKKIFSDYIQKIFRYKEFNYIHEHYNEMKISEEEEVIFDGWCELERQIRDFKEGTNLEKINKKDKFPINCSLFQDFYEDDIDINDLINNFNNMCDDDDLKLKVKSKKKWIIDFPYKIIHNYIQIQANLICQKIKEILNKIGLKKQKIDTIIFVGGYCSNEVLLSIIKKNLFEINNFLQPSNPSLAIMEGAVLFGLNPNIIDTRISKYTIGQGTRAKWDDNKHSKRGKKVYDEEDNIYRCENCFSKFIEVNQTLKINQEITNSYKMFEPRYCKLNFYQSKNPNPIFTFEEGVEKIGECLIDAGKDYPVDERDVKVTMKFGGTFIDVNAKHEKSGKDFQTSLNFS